jgi:hypothetical protein
MGSNPSIGRLPTCFASLQPPLMSKLTPTQRKTRFRWGASPCRVGFGSGEAGESCHRLRLGLAGLSVKALVASNSKRLLIYPAGEGDRGSEKSQGVTSATERPAKRSSSFREPTTAVVFGIGSSNRLFRPFRRCLDEARSPKNLPREQASPYPARGLGKTSDQVEGRRDDLDLWWQGSNKRQTGRK